MGRMMWYGIVSVFVFFMLLTLKASGLFMWNWMFILSPLYTFWIVYSLRVIYTIAKEAWNGR